MSVQYSADGRYWWDGQQWQPVQRSAASGQVLVRVYHAKRQSDAAHHFQRDAGRLVTQGFQPVSQSWAEGRSGCLRVIMLGFIGALVWKPKGTLTVTYHRT